MATMARNGRNIAKEFDLKLLAQKEIEIILRTIKDHREIIL